MLCGASRSCWRDDTHMRRAHLLSCGARPRFAACFCAAAAGRYDELQARERRAALTAEAVGLCTLGQVGWDAPGRTQARGFGGASWPSRSPRSLPGPFPSRDRRGAARCRAAAMRLPPGGAAASRGPPRVRPSGALALLAAALLLAAAPCRAQTYTNENLLGVQAYSAFAPPSGPSAAVVAPYVYRPPPASTAACVGVGGTCVPVAIAGNPAVGYWLTRGGKPYWITCVCCSWRLDCRCAPRAFASPAPRLRLPLRRSALLLPC